MARPRLPSGGRRAGDAESGHAGRSPRARAPSPVRSGFTGGMSDAPGHSSAAAPTDPAGSAALGGLTGPDGTPALAVRRPWSAWSEARGDLRSSAAVLGGLALLGFPVGLLWWWLAPR